MKNFIYIITVVLLSFSCKKDKNIEPLTTPSILHYEFNNQEVGLEKKTIEIDFDNDGIVDFQLSSSGPIEELECGVGGGSPVTCYTVSHFLNTNNNFFISKTVPYNFDFYEYGDEVSTINNWDSQSLLCLSNIPENATKCECMENTIYIGVKKKIGRNPYYGWIRLNSNDTKTELIEFAISTTPNTSIKMGQIN